MDLDLDETLSAQIEYYRRRAPEYDETSVECVEWASRHFGRLVEKLDPSGDVLEIACGTGLWTQHLASRARSLTALDSSPEMIELARSRVGGAASFIVSDVFAWEPQMHFDSVFFGFWLSHVPPPRFNGFWELLGRCLAPKGHVLFVDEGAPRASLEHVDRGLGPRRGNPADDATSSRAAGQPSAEPVPVVKRRLLDGTVHEVVKIFYDRDQLVRKLAGLGWSAHLELTSDGLLAGSARPARRPA